MKNCFLIVLCLLLTVLFCVACAQPAVTPTDTTGEPASMVTQQPSSAAVSDVASAESTASFLAESTGEESGATPAKNNASQDAPAPITSTPASSRAVSSAASKPAVPAPASGVPAVSSQPSASSQVGDADLSQTNPTFYTESTFQNWLKAGKNKTHERTALLEGLGATKTVTYYRPRALTQSDRLILSSIEVHMPSFSLNYVFNAKSDPDTAPHALEMVVVMAEPAQRAANGFAPTINDVAALRELCESGLPDSEIHAVEGVTFYCSFVKEKNMVTVAWEQNGLGYLAQITGHANQLEAWLPLLILDPVTIQIS